ncbi:MAG: hypothetical protein H0X17_24105 [Deltaproteobacteria bacterium]|nr:hypothetical protein [Deltaproteobacteria bacterium]
MSTGAIIAIVVVALIIIGLLVMLPRMRGAASQKQAERELGSRRETVATEHREAAAQGENRAELAERKARIAEQEAQRDRAEAKLQSERAEMHDRGLADDELIDDSERDRFDGVTGPGSASTSTSDRSADVDRDGHTLDDRARAATDRDHDQQDGPASPDYQRGREDERRES